MKAVASVQEETVHLRVNRKESGRGSEKGTLWEVVVTHGKVGTASGGSSTRDLGPFMGLRVNSSFLGQH